jgi:hypothetical protein
MRIYGAEREVIMPDKDRSPTIVTSPPTVEIPGDQNPWGVPVLDIRAMTRTVGAASHEPTMAENFLLTSKDDGRGFVDAPWPTQRTLAVSLRYPIERYLADGILFAPQVMEHKWAVYFYKNTLLFVRTWLRQVIVTARVQLEGESALITDVTGDFFGEPADQTPRVVDFMVRTHALGLPHPAPIEANPIICFHLFGSLVWFTTRFEVPWHAPSRPLRTDSLLHIAIARRDTQLAQQQLERGVPIDVLGRDGLSPLHWSLHSSLAGADPDMSSWLLDRGVDVDVRSAEGATPLMNAVQGRNLDKVAFLIDRGANPNAQDYRGFTALHRAAESGQSDVVNALLARGADPGIAAANGHAAASLAAAQGHEAIAERLSRTRGG